MTEAIVGFVRYPVPGGRCPFVTQDVAGQGFRIAGVVDRALLGPLDSPKRGYPSQECLVDRSRQTNAAKVALGIVDRQRSDRRLSILWPTVPRGLAQHIRRYGTENRVSMAYLLAQNVLPFLGSRASGALHSPHSRSLRPGH